MVSGGPARPNWRHRGGPPPVGRQKFFQKTFATLDGLILLLLYQKISEKEPEYIRFNEWKFWITFTKLLLVPPGLNSPVSLLPKVP